MRPIRKILCVLAFASLALAPLTPLRAGVFNPEMIISDSEMRDYLAMDQAAIAKFLDEKGGLNRRFDVDAADGLLKNSAQLIADAAGRYRINPKYILALLQKESSAVETDEPDAQQLAWAAGYALCDGCSKRSPTALKYKGLGKQIDAGAGWMDWFLTNGPTLAGLRQPGVACSISSTRITPANLATAALYNYTPHLQGNRLLWSIWNRWFESGAGPTLPDGTLIRNEKNGAVAVIQGGKFRPILRASVLETRFAGRSIVDLNEYDFSELEEKSPGRPIRFADLSLVRTEDGSTFLLVGAARRRIASAEVFAKIGFNPEEVEDVAAADIEDYADGEAITLQSTYPAGQLVQDSRTGGIYYAEMGVKHPLWDRSLLALNFAGRSILPLAADELSALADGRPVTLDDGILVKAAADPTVYVISGGKKRPIASEEAFVAFGYKWTDIVTVGRKLLELHPTGDPLALPSAAAAALAVSTKI